MTKEQFLLLSPVNLRITSLLGLIVHSSLEFSLRHSELLLSSSGSTNNATDTLEDTWKGTKSSTDEVTPAQFLLLSSGSGTGDSSDDGRKETSEETENHFLFLRVHLLHGFLETVESESSTESTDVTTS